MDDNPDTAPAAKEQSVRASIVTQSNSGSKRPSKRASQTRLSKTMSQSKEQLGSQKLGRKSKTGSQTSLRGNSVPTETLEPSGVDASGTEPKSDGATGGDGLEGKGSVQEVQAETDTAEEPKDSAAGGDAAVESRLTASLDAFDAPAQPVEAEAEATSSASPDHTVVGDEITVHAQTARTLTSPMPDLWMGGGDDGGFLFVHASSIEEAADSGGVGDAATVSAAWWGDALAGDEDASAFAAAGVRTPLMRASSPTWVPPTIDKDPELKSDGVVGSALAADSRPETSAPIEETTVVEIIDREAVITEIKSQLELKEKLRARNVFLQNKIGEYFKRKRTDADSHDAEKSVADQHQRYANCIASLMQLRTESDALTSTNSKIANEFKVKLEAHTQDAQERGEEFIAYKRSIALAAENSRTGKPIPAKTVSQLEALDQRKDVEVVAVRLDHIKLRNKLKRHEILLRQKEELADGLHLIDFEQLKIENQTYNEKIEERNEELLKLRKKITNIVQVLTHVKEKLQFVQAENSRLRKDLKSLDRDVAVRRDSLPAAKQGRDAVRSLNLLMRQKNGMLGNKALLRDYENKVVSEIRVFSELSFVVILKDETDSLRARIDELRTIHANLSAETLSIKRMIQRKLIGLPFNVFMVKEWLQNTKSELA
ncbi:Coiled-coil domain-containing protein 96 [Entophlyctis sp. JEL0112]|nr:Coiled-coil domain-containing protein 96 [Entophlyctis sp. JEL0112]